MLTRLFCVALAGGLLALCCGCSGTPSSGSAAADLKTYVNSPEGRTGELRERYADFSFAYPTSWAEVPSADNYVRVERSLPGEKPGEKFTLEQVSVGTFTSDYDPAAGGPRVAEAAASMSEQFARGFPDYRLVSQGPATVGAYKGYEVRFTARVADSPKGPVDIWGRVVFFLPPGGGRNGVSLCLLATSLAADMKGADDVGFKGEMPVILNSFKLGK